MQKVIKDKNYRLRDDFGKSERPRSHYDRWHHESVVRQGHRFKRLSELEAQNRHLRQAISNLRRDKLFLEETVRGLPTLYRDH